MLRLRQRIVVEKIMISVVRPSSATLTAAIATTATTTQIALQAIRPTNSAVCAVMVSKMFPRAIQGVHAKP